ncbi:lysine--tRNA ligase, partial [PVC group bacterium]|nr:lysine--tRNA ligase [PVC group bacterium]
ISPRHNPEFTMLEAYAAYADYQDMMDLTEEIICGVAESVLETQCLKYQNALLDLKRPWERLGFHEAIEKYADVKLDQEKDVPALAKKLEVKFDPGMIDDAILLEIFDEKVEPNLVGPIFIVDYPARLCPLTKIKEGHPDIAERFELYLGGQEVANAYSELNHPIIQRDKFEKQIEDHINEGEVKSIDYDYIRALEYGMPPAGGLGIGIDRLVMILTNMTNIRDVILFPQMKPEPNE